uniref:Splicing factor 1 n=1 Tax=Lotharella vacuolata TaxID=74820 RepID=A0A0H5BK18_9EUKA|nr:splicing factor 1 [Lotharella vacuolata]
MIKKTKWKFKYYNKDKIHKTIESIFYSIKNNIINKYNYKNIYSNKIKKNYEINNKNNMYYQMVYNRIKNFMINKKNKIIEKFIQYNKNYRPPKDYIPQNFSKKIVIADKNNNFNIFAKLFFSNFGLINKIELETSTKILCNEVPLKNISKHFSDYFLNSNEICLVVTGDNREKVYLNNFKVNHAINILRQLTREDIKSKGVIKINYAPLGVNYNRNKISSSYIHTTNKNSELFIKKFGNIIKISDNKKNNIKLKNKKNDLNKYTKLSTDMIKKTYLNFLESIYNFRYKVNLFSNIRYSPLIKPKHTLLIWDIGNDTYKSSIVYKFIAFGLIEFNKNTRYYNSLRYSILVFRNPYNLKEAKDIMNLKFFFSKKIKVKII